MLSRDRLGHHISEHTGICKHVDIASVGVPVRIGLAADRPHHGAHLSRFSRVWLECERFDTGGIGSPVVIPIHSHLLHTHWKFYRPRSTWLL